MSGRPLTRAQTAAARAAAAAAALAERETEERQRLLAEHAAREQRVRANFPGNQPALDTLNARHNAELRRLDERFAIEGARLRGDTNEALTDTFRVAARDSAVRTREYRRHIDETRRTMEKNVSSLFNIDEEIYRYLNVQQMLYFTTKSLEDSYYYRKLELSYGIPTIDKFNQISQDIITNIQIHTIIDDDDVSNIYRYDIDYYSQIVRFLEVVNFELTILSNKQEIKSVIISDINSNILREKNILLDLKEDLTTLRTRLSSPSQRILDNITDIIAKIDARYAELDSVTLLDLDAYFSAEKFEKARKYSILILESIKTLCKICLLLIIKLYINQNINNRQPQLSAMLDDEYTNIISNMFNAIVNFTLIINRSSSEIEEIAILILIQNSLYNTLSRSFADNTIIQDYNTRSDITYENSTTTAMPRRLQNIHPLTFELGSAPSDPALSRRSAQTRSEITSQRTIAITIANQVREQAIATRDAERAAARAARDAARAARDAALIAARDAARAARDAARAARGSARSSTRGSARSSARGSAASVSAPSAASGPVTQHLSVAEIESKFEIDANAANRFENTYIVPAADRYKIPPTPGAELLLTKLQEKYIEYSKNFKSANDKKILFNDFNSKFKTKFNSEEPVVRIDQSIENFAGNSIASLFARYKFNTNDIKFNDLGKYYVINFTVEEDGIERATGKKKYKKVRQAGIDAGGLRRDFITALTSELFEKEIFITREGTKKYYLNPHYKPDDIFKWIVLNKTRFDIETSEEQFYELFYKFLGTLLSFILVNDCGIQHYISSYLIAKFSNASQGNIDKYDYVYFMLKDFPEFATSIFNLMADPATIEYTCIGFNDYYKLLDVDKELDANNIEEYLKLVSKFMMKKTILRKDIDIQGYSDDDYNALIKKSKKMHKHFIEGIPDDIKNYFSKFPINTIDSYIVTPTMSDEIVNKIKSNFTASMVKRNRTKTGIDKDNHEKLTRLFISHVLTQGPHMNDAQKTSEENKADFFKFIDKLLKFWSGSSFYKEKEEYKIQINDGLSAAHLPQSHTCFFLIDLPNYIQPRVSDEAIASTLYGKIKDAIFNVEEGIGFVGGSKKSKKSKPSKKSKTLKTSRKSRRI